MPAKQRKELKQMIKKVISTRLEPKHIAKALDGLKQKDYELDQISTLSSIVRLTFYYGLVNLCSDVEAPASKEATIWVNQRMLGQTGKKNITLNDVLKP